MRYAAAVLVAIFVAPSAHAITFAQFAIGGGYEATLILSNTSSFDWSGKIWVRQGADQRWAGQWSCNGQSFSGYDYLLVRLPSKSSLKLLFRGDAQTRTGYLKVDPDMGSYESDLAVAYFYSYYSGGRLVNLTGSGLSEEGDILAFPVEIGPGIDTGYALCPYIGTPPFQVKLTLFDHQGQQRASTTINYTGHFAEFVSQRFPNLPQPFIGHMVVEAQWMMGLEVLRMEYGQGWFLLTSTPAKWLP